MPTLRLVDVVNVEAVALLVARRTVHQRQRHEQHQETERLAAALLQVLDHQPLERALDALARVWGVCERPLLEAARCAVAGFRNDGRPPGREVACEPRERLPACRLAPGVGESVEG